MSDRCATNRYRSLLSSFFETVADRDSRWEFAGWRPTVDQSNNHFVSGMRQVIMRHTSLSGVPGVFLLLRRDGHPRIGRNDPGLNWTARTEPRFPKDSVDYIYHTKEDFWGRFYRQECKWQGTTTILGLWALLHYCVCFYNEEETWIIWFFTKNRYTIMAARIKINFYTKNFKASQLKTRYRIILYWNSTNFL